MQSSSSISSPFQCCKHGCSAFYMKFNFLELLFNTFSGFKPDYLQVFQVHPTIYSYLFPYIWYAHHNKFPTMINTPRWLHNKCVQGTPCITSSSLGQPTSQWVLPRRDIWQFAGGLQFSLL